MIEGRALRRLAIAASTALTLAACGGDGGNEERAGGQEVQPSAGIETDATLVITRGDGGDSVEIDVAVADTQEERTSGLMGVEELGDDQGMVFLHEEPTASGFWMKNTLIPLSLAVWDEGGTVLAILDMEPCEEDPCPTYDPGVAWVGAVEVNQGFFQEYGVAVGDVAELRQ